MIEEDYVSFELAKMLKEKVFDEPTMSFFRGDKIIWQQAFYPTDIKRPTLQMAQKWLREVHKLYISLFTFDYQFDEYGWMFLIKPLKYTEDIGWCWNSDYVHEKKWSNDIKYNTYEEAVEAAIKYCLQNLI